MIQLYTMVSTTNERFKYLEGSIGFLQYDTQWNVYWFNDFHTSLIVSEKKTKNTITLQTLNSVYKFKKVKEKEVGAE